MKKNNFKNVCINIKKHIWAYLLVIASASCLSYYVVDMINKPKNEETITLFIASYGIDDSLNKKLWSVSPSYLREMQIRTFNFENSDFSTYYDALGKTIADVIVLPKSKMVNETILDYYARFSEEIINEYFKTKEIYTFEYLSKEYKSGVCIHRTGEKGDGSITFSTKDTNDQDYYAFVRKNSIHAGKLNNSSFDTALKYLQVL